MDIPTWFPAASNDRFPPDDQIVLGSIITNPKQPENSLNNPTDLVPIPINLYIKTLCDLDHSSEVERNLDHNAGIQLKVAEFIDSELSHGWGNRNKRGIDATKITSTNFRPDVKYIADSVAKKVIADHLKHEVGYFKKKAPNLYMVTGVKIAKQALISRSQERTTTDKVNINTNIGPVPVSVGPFGDRSAEDKHSESFRPDGEFVYAIRLKKFVFQKRKPALETEYFTDGAEIHGDEKKVRVEESYEFEIVLEEDVGADTFEDSKNIRILDGDEGVSIFSVWPEEDEDEE